ncbi:MAG: hypothetical protein BTN85_1916 [Candidatus Methanohalarchaeum thermophilum]|uniref:Uncharacterized protein n=1 Tax=Methanohalarchaeum thermophilum TaxID=1903181 RepID=A0A1Q6DSF2_METT1|nr:MAG: hypothetical protein BTN85_1916 [Candidatus Methanohalarchaeum thermophilum]
MYNKLPKWKKTSNPEFQNVYSKTAQQTIGRIYDAIKALNTKKEKGKKVGKLRYKNSINSIENQPIRLQNKPTKRNHTSIKNRENTRKLPQTNSRRR